MFVLVYMHVFAYACMHTNDKGAWDDLMKKEEEVIKELKWIAKAIVPFNKQGFPIWVKEELDSGFRHNCRC